MNKIDGDKMHKYTVALIGAGQLGSRHLQGLAKCCFDISIEVVEPFEAARVTAKSRYEEVQQTGKAKDIKLLTTIDDLSDVLDVVIVATNSDVRFSTVKELLSKKRVRYLVLEKVLFQCASEYYETEKILAETGTRCFVNHPRRMYPFYQSLKQELKAAEKISLSVQGGGWGLACNGLHFIDNLSFLTDSHNPVVHAEGLENKLYETKRAGFIEFYGNLSGSLGNNTFSLSCFQEHAPFTVTVSSDVLNAFIDEVGGFARIARKDNGWKWEDMAMKIIYFQSELTSVLTDELLINQTCSLPSFNDASNLHIPFISALMNKMEEIKGQPCVRCPIT